MSEERLELIESKLAYQEQSLNELDEALAGQQARIAELEALCKSLISRVQTIGEAVPQAGAEDERPPHY